MPPVTSVAVVGLGAMGSRIARRLVDAGREVVVWNRTPERAQPLLDLGAASAATPAEAARSADVLITMVSDPAALRQVTEDANGVAAGADGSLSVIDMSTVGPEAVHRLRTALPPETGLLDAPVLGSVSEAEAGSLAVFVGGPETLVERWRPLLAVLGRPLYVGPLGSGAAAKLVANTTLVGMIAVLGEALSLGKGLGLLQEATFEVLGVTALGAQAERRRRAVETGEYPPRFSLSLAHKDADLISRAAAAHDLDLRVTEAARSWLADAEAARLGDRDYSAVLARILGRV
jgi:3-hydroxyisobutyrate dehydrogenase/2-hydroxy-3-oxopropionate reductase